MSQEIDRLSFEKIFYQKDHLDQLLTIGEAYPIHLDLGLVNYCNHDCTFCYAKRSMFDSMGVPRQRIEIGRLMEIIEEMAGLGLKSVTLVGSGEPTLHPQTHQIIAGIHERGVEVGIFTNGSGLRPDVNQALVEHCKFVRFSLTGASRRVHDIVHANGDYEKILGNICQLVEFRGARRFPTLGIQFVLASYSAEDVVRGAEQARDLGVDYYEIKPVFPSVGKTDQLPNTLASEDAITLMMEAKKYETPSFKVYAKSDQLKGAYANIDDRIYDDCPGCRTSTTLESDFKLYICDNQKAPQYCFGNLGEQSFEEVWNGNQRKEILEFLNVHKCPPHCRMDPLNVIIQQIRNGDLAVPEKLGAPDEDIHPNFL